MGAVTEDLFIEPGANLQEGDQDLITVVNLTKEDLQNRWSTQAGQSLLKRWQANEFSRDQLDKLVGRYYDHYDLRGIPLTNQNLKGIDLSSIDFYGANLEGSDFTAANLNDSWLSETNIKGVKFDWAKMDDVLLDNVDFDHRTSFIGVNLGGINFTLAALVQDLAVGQQRIAHLKQKHRLFSFFLWITCDYGRSFRRYITWCVSVILIFSLLYALIPDAISKPGHWNSIYFSVITFTTLGYGDIHPGSLVGQVLATIEVITGYIMGGLLIAILGRRVIGN